MSKIYHKMKTPLGELEWVCVTGEGKNVAFAGAEPKIRYEASVKLHGDSPALKAFKEEIRKVWEQFKEETGTKGLPEHIGVKPIMIPDPDGEIDPKTEEVKKVPSEYVRITARTTTVTPDGKPKVVPIYDPKGRDITQIIRTADEQGLWTIGNGSKGVLYITAQPMVIGDAKTKKKLVVLYLNALQLAELKKYTGATVEVDELGGDYDLDLEDDIGAVSAIEEDEEMPF